jgi:hypothetical protein
MAKILTELAYARPVSDGEPAMHAGVPMAFQFARRARPQNPWLLRMAA